MWGKDGTEGGKEEGEGRGGRVERERGREGLSSSVFVSSLCKALLVLFVVWSQVMCAMFL